MSLQPIAYEKDPKQLKLSPKHFEMLLDIMKKQYEIQSGFDRSFEKGSDIG